VSGGKCSDTSHNQTNARVISGTLGRELERGGGVQQSASGSTNMITSAQILKSHPRSAQCVSVGLSAGHNGETRGMHALISPMYLIRVAR